MTRRLLVLALCALVGAGTVSAAQQPAPATPRPSPLAGDLVRLFPERTAFYVEIPHLGTFVDIAGDREALLTSVNEFLGDTGAKAEALRPAELGALLDAGAAAGLISADGSQNFFAIFGSAPNVAVLRMASDEGLAILRGRVFARYADGETKVRTETVRGLEVTHLPKFSYAVDGRTVVVGAASAVRAILETPGTDARRVGDDPGYNSAVAKHAAGRDALFGYIGGGTIRGTFDGMFGGGPDAPRPKGEKVDRAKQAEEEALRKFLGFDAIQGMALSVTVDGEGAIVRYDFEIDRTRTGLATAITDPPMVSFRAASLLPASVEQVQLASVDAIRIYDLLERHFGPLPVRSPGGLNFAGTVADIEAKIGMSLRRELLPALGNEVAYVTNIGALMPPPPPAEDPDGVPDGVPGGAPGGVPGGPPPEPQSPVSLVFVEVREREVARRAIVSLVKSFLPGLPAALTEPVEYKGVEIWKGPGIAAGLGADFVLFGPEAKVRECIDAQESGETLAKVPDYATEASRWAGSAIYASYLSPKYREKLQQLMKRYEEIAKANRPKGEAADDEEEEFADAPNLDPFSDITTTPIFRDGTGVHWESRAQADGLRSMFARFVKKTLVSEPRANRRRESEAAARGLVDEIAASEKLHREKTGRFGSLDAMAASGALERESLDRIQKGEHGYRIQVVLAGEGYHVVATPAEYGRWGRRSFFADETGKVRGADKKGEAADAADPLLEPEHQEEPDVDEPPAPETE